MKDVLHSNRESYLTEAVNLFKPLFKRAANVDIPPVRVSTGWPSTKALSAKAKRIGECWDASASTDNTPQIFISPWLDDIDGPGGVLSTLAHELVHAFVGCEAKHGPRFAKPARAIGLAGKLTATHANDVLLEELKAISEKLGAYPHAKLDLLLRPTKKQSTRMVKCECAECGYTVRTSRKWLEIGAPICPVHKSGPMHYELPADEENESDE